jgi:phosphomevalonate kinase
VTHVIEQLVRDGRYDVRDHGPLTLEIDTTAFSMASDAGRKKLGLGSSAAATVVLASVLVGWTRAGRAPEPDRRWLRDLVVLHRKLQGGRGSGIDVAASLLGGAIEFRCHVGSGEPSAQPLELPEGLHLSLVWTGRVAGTTDFLKRLEARRAVGVRAVDSALSVLADASDRGLASLGASRVGGFLGAVDAFWSGLHDLGCALEMPILSAEHLQLWELANQCGAHYKPSGAGGGDLGVAFAESGGPLREFEHRAREAGFLVPDMTVDRVGLEVEGM